MPSILPLNAYALDSKEPHWFGLGSGAYLEKSIAPFASFQAGRLWSEHIGSGGFFVFPTPSAGNRMDFLTLGSVDFFDQAHGLHYSLLAGLSKNGNLYPFTLGSKISHTEPLSRHWNWGGSVAAFFLNLPSSLWSLVLQIEVQFRY